MKLARMALSVGVAALLASAAPVNADGHIDGAVKARKGLMQLYAHYLGTLGGMAKGEVDYDAERAGAAASSLAALMTVDQMAMWPEGSDNGALGDATRALPAMWTTFPAVLDKSKAMNEAVTGLNGAAGGGLDALRAAMGPVGKACGSCHEDFRQAKN